VSAARTLAAFPAALAVVCALTTGCAPGNGPTGAEPVRNGGAQSGAPATAEFELRFDGLDRSYRVTAPAGIGQQPLPVLVALHGAGGSAVTLSYLTGFDRALAEQPFLLVEPNGTGPDPESRTWNAGNCCGSSVGVVDDVGFLSEVLDRVAAEYPVDTSRVYLSGFSNGGMLAYRAACELGERIAGISVVAATMNVENCPAPSPVPVLAIHGSDDQIVQFEGGQSNYADPRVEPWYNVPVENSVAFWAQRNGCDAPIETTVGSAIVREWSGCAVELWVVQGGRHTWFGGPMSAAGGLEPAGAPSATELTLDFFGLRPSR
jgi:polyhydroxybutyrate depolymerase